MHWSDAYMRIPFKDGGRGPDYFDCYGLVAAVMLDQKGIILPAYGEISATDLAKIGVEIERDANDYEQWLQIDRVKEFDVCVMRWFGKRETGHVGIMLDENRVLHTENHTGPMIVPITHFSIKSRIKYFRRHRELA